MTLLQQNASPRTLRAVTILVFGIWAVKMALTQVYPLTLLPHAVYEPVRFLGFLPESALPLLTNLTFLYVLQGAVLIGCAGVILNVCSIPAGLLVCVCLTLYEGIARGFAGHMHHGNLLLLYAAYLLALYRLADALAGTRQNRSLTSKISVAGIPLVAILTVLCVSYTFTGLYRLTHGGLEIYTSGSLLFWATRNSYQTMDRP